MFKGGNRWYRNHIIEEWVPYIHNTISKKMTVRDFGVSVTQNVSPLLHVSNVVAIKIGISMQHWHIIWLLTPFLLLNWPQNLLRIIWHASNTKNGKTSITSVMALQQPTREAVAETVAEIVAACYSCPLGYNNCWLPSPAHRSLIIRLSVNKLKVAVSQSTTS